MEITNIKKILENLSEGKISIDQALSEIKYLFNAVKSFYCYEEGGRGRCDVQCSWCKSNPPKKTETNKS